MNDQKIIKAAMDAGELRRVIQAHPEAAIARMAELEQSLEAAIKSENRLIAKNCEQQAVIDGQAERLSNIAIYIEHINDRGENLRWIYKQAQGEK